MATCKDCAHYEPCFSGGQSVWNNIEQTKDDCCKHFKNNDDFVEIVRCKNCRMAEENLMIDGWYYCHNNGMSHKPNHFCSYGERKEK